LWRSLFNRVGEDPVPDKQMKYLLPLLFALLALAILAESEMTAQLSGKDGLAALKSLANVSTNLSNNTTLNLSATPGFAQLGGEQGLEWWTNLTNESMNLSDHNGSNNLSSWGSPLRPPPGPPSASGVRSARMAQVIRNNHIVP